MKWFGRRLCMIQLTLFLQQHHKSYGLHKYIVPKTEYFSNFFGPRMEWYKHLDTSEDSKVSEDTDDARAFRNTQYLTLFRAKTSGVDIY